MFHILVADDDKHTRMLLRAVLENANYTVTTAENGEEALDVLGREHIDLVVLDVMMPKMDGYEFTKLIRETDNALPILMVTAKHLPADEKRGFLVGTVIISRSPSTRKSCCSASKRCCVGPRS